MEPTNHIHIPDEFWHFFQVPGYFFTYYGDVYLGILYRGPANSNSYFIIPIDKKQEFYKLKDEEKTIEKYREFGWEIKTFDIFRRAPIEADVRNPLGCENKYKQHTRYGNSTYKRMFVFGAGASAFCTFGDDTKKLRSSKLRPPVGYEIFDDDFQPFCEKYEGVKLTLPVYESKGRDIEGCMEDEWKMFRHSYNPELLRRHINVQYYLQELFNTISNNVINNHHRKNLYSLFANKLQLFHKSNVNEKSSIVSFNYDTILDYYLTAAFDWQLNTTNDYIDYENSFLFFKPHGSCNWGWKYRNDRLPEIAGNGTLADRIYKNKVELWHLYYYYLGDVDQNLAKNSWGFESQLHPNHVGRFTLNKNRIEVINEGELSYPALLLPYRDKDELLMPYDHQNSIRTAVNEVEELYLIGWKGNEAVFNRMLDKQANRLRKIIIVNPNENKNQEVSTYLKSYPHLATINMETVEDFEDFVINKLDMYLQ